MDKCTCKITPGTSAYGGNQIDSRGCEKHDTRDEIIEQLRQERDNALRYTELLIAERDAARAGEARAVEACQFIEEALQGTDFADHGLDSPVWNALELVRDVTADEPALAWLAQQRREAAAEALESVRIGWLSDNNYRPGVPEIWRYIANRAASLRTGEVGNE